MTQRIQDEPWFQRAEAMIRDYWRRAGQIQRLDARLLRAEERLREIEADIAGARSVRSLSQALSFTPGSLGGAFGSGLDVELERIEDQLEALLQRYAEKRREALELRARIANLRSSNAAMETVMARLSLEEYRYTEQRWVYRRSNYAVAQVLHCGASSVRRMRVRVARQVAGWLGMTADAKRRKNGAQDSALA